MAIRIIRPPISQLTAAAAPNAKLSLDESAGHAPVFEDAPRFNCELAAFVRAAKAG
jgi:pimeloyl-ACP methyl ester carboxylesterase